MLLIFCLHRYEGWFCKDRFDFSRSSGVLFLVASVRCLWSFELLESEVLDLWPFSEHLKNQLLAFDLVLSF